MTNSFGRWLCVFGAAVVVAQLLGSYVVAVDTVADWVGSNNTADGNNYTVQNSTTVGGTFRDVTPTNVGNNPTYILADTALEGGAKNFQTPLHMSGTMTFSNATPVIPNLCFCWFSSANTTHRIGLGFADNTTAPWINLPNNMRIDLGWGATGGSFFPFASKDGRIDENNYDSVIPDGTYNFTFDYTPGTTGNSDGSMSATVSNGSVTVFSTNINLGAQVQAPADYDNNGTVEARDYVSWRKGGDLLNEVDNPGTNDAGDYAPWRTNFGQVRTGTLNKVWDNDFFDLDYFGFVQRFRTNPPGTGGTYSLAISNITYTGGTPVAGSGSGLEGGAVPEPTTALLASLAGLAMVASRRRRS